MSPSIDNWSETPKNQSQDILYILLTAALAAVVSSSSGSSVDLWQQYT
jgi:hypothetical protein